MPVQRSVEIALPLLRSPEWPRLTSPAERAPRHHLDRFGLAGDNAVVVGMAAAGLPREQRTKVIVLGIAAATTCASSSTSPSAPAADHRPDAGRRILLLWGVLEAVARVARPAPRREGRRRPRGRGWQRAATADFDGSLKAATPAMAGGRERPSARRRCQIVIADVSMSPKRARGRRHRQGTSDLGARRRPGFSGRIHGAPPRSRRLLKRLPWIAYVGRSSSSYVAGKMIWDGTHEVVTEMAHNYHVTPGRRGAAAASEPGRDSPVPRPDIAWRIRKSMTRTRR